MEKVSKYQSPKPHPYTPPGKHYQYVKENHPSMKKAKILTAPLREEYPHVVVTGSVVVKDGDILGQGINNPVHRSFCVRTAFACPSGQGYELCPTYCHSDNHSEAKAIADARAKGYQTKGADLYLYGHWWCCQPCWEKMIDAGIKNVFLVQGATELFDVPVSGKVEPLTPLAYYFAGGLTHLQGQKEKELYERIASLLARVNLKGYVPHLFSDPLKNPALTPEQVYERNAGIIQKSDFVLAYLGAPSLGVGVELELANKWGKPVIGFAPQGVKVSRMALGVPSLAAFFVYDSIEGAIMEISEIIGDKILYSPS